MTAGEYLVGAEGFEPPTSCSQSRRATRLRYAPNKLAYTMHIRKINVGFQISSYAGGRSDIRTTRVMKEMR
jgi:hypothetical protein